MSVGHTVGSLRDKNVERLAGRTVLKQAHATYNIFLQMNRRQDVRYGLPVVSLGKNSGLVSLVAFGRHQTQDILKYGNMEKCK